jgi:hypothetical protein
MTPDLGTGAILPVGARRGLGATSGRGDGGRLLIPAGSSGRVGTGRADATTVGIEGLERILREEWRRQQWLDESAFKEATHA